MTKISDLGLLIYAICKRIAAKNQSSYKPDWLENL